MSFDCLEVAHEALVVIGPLIEKVERRNRSLAEQLQRASVSIVSHIDEGRGAKPQQKAHFFRMALGSAREVTSQIRVAQAWGYVDDTRPVLEILDRVRAMLWRLSS
jgi:four helix bundle protein